MFLKIHQNNRKRFCAFQIAEVSKLTNSRGIAFTKVVLNNIFRYQQATILDFYVNGYLYRQNNLTNEFLDLKLVDKKVLLEIFEQIFQYILFKYVVWRPFWIYMSMVTYIVKIT